MSTTDQAITAPISDTERDALQSIRDLVHEMVTTDPGPQLGPMLERLSSHSPEQVRRAFVGAPHMHSYICEIVELIEKGQYDDAVHQMFTRRPHARTAALVLIRRIAQADHLDAFAVAIDRYARKLRQAQGVTFATPPFTADLMRSAGGTVAPRGDTHPAAQR